MHLEKRHFAAAPKEQDMSPNAYVLAWTMNDYDTLKAELAEAGFVCTSDGDDLRVSVPFARVSEAAALFQKHLNAPYNYVDLQYPASKTTVVVFQQRVYLIRSAEENRTAQAWAMAQGLPAEQADWGTSF
jgi:hypothetical protein